MAEEILNKYSIKRSAIQPIMALFDDKPNGSIMVASDQRAHALSGNFTYAEPKNGKIIAHSDGVNSAYLKAVLDGKEDGVIVFRKATDSRMDMSVFRPKESDLSGIFYADDPAMLSADGVSWYFIQGLHADPDGTRYQQLSTVHNNLVGVKRDWVYCPNEISKTGLLYFSEECEKNGNYVDKMIHKGRIKSADKQLAGESAGSI